MTWEKYIEDCNRFNIDPMSKENFDTMQKQEAENLKPKLSVEERKKSRKILREVTSKANKGKLQKAKAVKSAEDILKANAKKAAKAKLYRDRLVASGLTSEGKPRKYGLYKDRITDPEERKEARRIQKLEYARQRRKQFIEAGLTTTGKERILEQRVKRTPEEKAERRRYMDALNRQRYVEAGLTTHGKPRKAKLTDGEKQAKALELAERRKANAREWNKNNKERKNANTRKNFHANRSKTDAT